MIAESRIRLTEDQVADLWDRRISAEVRSLYFADLANVLSTRKQWITGLSFFLSSGAAATLIGKGPVWVPIVLSTFVAVITAYSVAVNLDASIKTLSKLHNSWGQLSNEYARLWNHAYAENADEEFEELILRDLELSESATADAPNDQARLARWQERVFQLHHLESA